MSVGNETFYLVFETAEGPFRVRWDALTAYLPTNPVDGRPTMTLWVGGETVRAWATPEAVTLAVCRVDLWRRAAEKI